ncbi:hypothetical protein C8R44DRAFT_769910 [Mycena epipterygia]|nr:hypothetical protein C8R44DRAFT_769910 [Mycena epipterygia]
MLGRNLYTRGRLTRFIQFPTFNVCCSIRALGLVRLLSSPVPNLRCAFSSGSPVKEEDDEAPFVKKLPEEDRTITNQWGLILRLIDNNSDRTWRIYEELRDLEKEHRDRIQRIEREHSSEIDALNTQLVTVAANNLVLESRVAALEKQAALAQGSLTVIKTLEIIAGIYRMRLPSASRQGVQHILNLMIEGKFDSVGPAWTYAGAREATIDHFRPDTSPVYHWPDLVDSAVRTLCDELSGHIDLYLDQDPYEDATREASGDYDHFSAKFYAPHYQGNELPEHFDLGQFRNPVELTDREHTTTAVMALFTIFHFARHLNLSIQYCDSRGVIHGVDC